MTVRCVAIAGYRSLHDLCFAPGPLTVISGGNGVGKSNVYRALELMHAAAQGRLARSLANEGGMPSAAWAGPEEVRTEAAKRRGQRIEPTVRRKPVRIRLGMQLDAGCFEMTIGLPPPDGDTAFSADPEVKEEWLWSAPPRRKNKPFLTRDGAAAVGIDSDGRQRTYAPLDASESVLGQLDEPQLLGDLWHLQRTLRAFRFYHAFRTDPESPLRVPRIGTRTPILASNGEDVAAALRTILEIGDDAALRDAVKQGLGAELDVEVSGNHFELGLRVPGLLRRLGARELSDGSLKYLALLAALFSPRPAPLLVFNEPEASLHPDLLVPLAEALALASRRSSVWVVSHARPLIAALESKASITRIELLRDEDGATRIENQGLLDRPPWP
ncbi:MAG: AAA family ATPase [Deltaproteobacteria bacterium]|nr:AAA family ATPase [Deltaproteobacteria bacterium]